jgi:hypothetical protein
LAIEQVFPVRFEVIRTFHPSVAQDGSEELLLKGESRVPAVFLEVEAGFEVFPVGPSDEHVALVVAVALFWGGVAPLEEGVMGLAYDSLMACFWVEGEGDFDAIVDRAFHSNEPDRLDGGFIHWVSSINLYSPVTKSDSHSRPST